MAERGTKPVPAEDRTRLAQQVEKIGESRLVALTGVSRQVVERALAGLPVRAGSRVLLRGALSELETTHGGSKGSAGDG
jgi:hypothetical protein